MVLNISFIIPSFNESKFIKGCLETIKRECENKDITPELIVVDNGSEDDTATLAKLITEQVYTLERTSISSARNYGVENSKHELIAFIDADVLITPTWVEALIENYAYFLKNPLLLSGHKYVIRDNPTWIEKYWFDNIQTKLINGGNLITSRAIFNKINGFNSELKTGEDYDYCQRAIEAGATFIDEKKFRAIHLGYSRTISQFMKREYWHGEGDFKSMFHFLRSPVAILGVFYLFLNISILVCIATGFFSIGLKIAAFLIVMNLIITIKRFSHSSFKTILVCSIINYGYFCARAVSLYRAIINRKNKY